MSLISRNDFPKQLPRIHTEYCFFCKSTNIKKTSNGANDNSRPKYKCDICGKTSDRILIWDQNMVQYFNDEGYLVHEGAGMLIQNEKNELLIFLRKKYPYLWTIPGGHMTPDENPKSAAVREIEEETGLKLDENAISLVYEGDLRGDECVGGADIHKWHLYHAYTTERDIKLDEEGSAYKWVRPENPPAEITFPLAFFLQIASIRKSLHISQFT